MYIYTYICALLHKRSDMFLLCLSRRRRSTVPTCSPS